MLAEAMPPPQPQVDAEGNKTEVNVLPFAWACLCKDGNQPKAMAVNNAVDQ